MKAFIGEKWPYRTVARLSLIFECKIIFDLIADLYRPLSGQILVTLSNYVIDSEGRGVGASPLPIEQVLSDSSHNLLG